MRIKLLIITGILSALQQWAGGQTTQPTGDAFDLYMKAAKIIRNDDAKNIMSPSASNGDFWGYLPRSELWVRMEKQDYDRHVEVRSLFHQAGMMQRATWPVIDRNNHGPDRLRYLNDSRNLVNEITDAAEYQSVILHDQPAAFASAGDVLRLAELLKNQPGENLIRLLTSVGLEAADMYHLMMMIANVKITDNPADVHDLPIDTATQWITRLLDQPDAQTGIDQAMKSEGIGSMPDVQNRRLLETIRQIQMERNFAAMSLAAHVYQFNNGKWPADVRDLYLELPRLPVDPWGDGKQSLGYALIPHGLPDGSDRPLVYSRYGMTDGLFFRIDEPQYGYYNNDGSRRPLAEQKHGGQFDDVTSWAPIEGKTPAATTQPLE